MIPFFSLFLFVLLLSLLNEMKCCSQFVNRILLSFCRFYCGNRFIFIVLTGQSLLDTEIKMSIRICFAILFLSNGRRNSDTSDF